MGPAPTASPGTSPAPSARPGPPAPQARLPPGRAFQIVVGVLLGLVLLRVTAPVTLPLAFALFLVAVFWPLEQRLRARLPRGVAVLLVFLAFLVTMGVLGTAIYLTALLVARQVPAYAELFAERFAEVRGWAVAHGLLVPGTPGGSPGVAAFIQDAVVSVSEQTLSFAGAFGLMIAFFLFALFELTDLPTKLAAAAPGREPGRWLAPFQNIASALLRYMLVRTTMGLATGAVVGLVTWAFGLDLVPIWALTTFLLNYIPIVGSAIAVIPPSLFAAVQFDSLGAAAVVLLVLTVIQFTIGNYIDPMVQGHYLSLSPLVVMISIALWGWIWGVVGAFIGVPITVAVMLACHQFDRTRWVAVLLADVEPGRRRRAPRPRRPHGRPT